MYSLFFQAQVRRRIQLWTRLRLDHRYSDSLLYFPVYLLYFSCGHAYAWATGYSVYLLYLYISANTDAAGAG